MNLDERKYGLIGHPLDHSFSKKYFDKKFNDLNLNFSYINIDLESLSNLKEIINENQLNGFNITIPYKTDILEHLDAIDEKALEIGAVNVVDIRNNRWHGYNTDYLGFKNSLNDFLDVKIDKALILGSGGASKAIKYALKELEIEFTLVSRNAESGISYEDIDEKIIHEHKLIINTTPLGTFPKIKEYPNIAYNFLTKNHYLFDLVYNPEMSEFLRKGAEQGSKLQNGYQMLINQAELSWDIWNQ